MRLSKADGDGESNSIASQREFLHQSLDRYALSQEDIVEYVDDGYSGKNFNRPGIRQLFQEIEQGIISTILVKDFSRFGRNYHIVSEYLERKFPNMGVRFIAVNNGYDSAKQEKSVIDIFSGIFDEYYSEENSQKIRDALSQKKRNGKYMASFAPYGYQIDPMQPGHLVIDQEAAEIVMHIFQMRGEGKSGSEIARYLNAKQILSPRDYQNKKRGKEGMEIKGYLWQSEVIWKIVRNKVYLGKLVVGKYRTIQTGSQKRKMLPSNQWMELESMHKAIVEKETFEKAQIIRKQVLRKEQREEGQNKKTAEKGLKGLIICNACGHKMKRKEGRNPFFFCKYYYYNQNPLCLKSGIKETWLCNLIRQVIELIFERGEGVRLEESCQSYQKKYQEKYKKKQKREKTKEKKIAAQIELKQYFLYEKWKAGLICKEEYQSRKDTVRREGKWEKEVMEREDREIGEAENKEKYGEKLRNIEYIKFFSELLQEVVLGVFISSDRIIRICVRIKANM